MHYCYNFYCLSFLPCYCQTCFLFGDVTVDVIVNISPMKKSVNTKFYFFWKNLQIFAFFLIFCWSYAVFPFFYEFMLIFGEFCEGSGIFRRVFFDFSEEFLRNYGSFWGESGDFPGVLGIVWSFEDNFFGDWGESWNFWPRIWSLRESFFGIWSESWIFFAGIWTFVMRFDIFLMFYR